MAKVKLGSNAQFTSAGKGLSIVGQHCYAFSGVVEMGTGTTSALDFTTGSYYILAELSINSTAGSGNNIDLEIEINGIDIVNLEISNDYQAYPDFGRSLKFLIPPLSNVVVKGAVATAAKDYTFVLTGRVYDA